MKIIKPIKPEKKPCTLDIDNSFYEYSHAYDIQSLQDYTLCGVGSEEFGYDNYMEVKKITCPDCLGVIRECKNYKL